MRVKLAGFGYWSQLLLLAHYSSPQEQEAISKEGHSEI